MKKRILKVIFFLILAILIIISYFLLNKRFGFGIPCLFHEITGLYCPGCGSTRMLFAILKGNIKEAFMFNQFVFILLPFLFLYVGYQIYLYIMAKKDTILSRIPNYVFIIVAVLAVIWGVVRNIDALSFLRP